MPRYNKRTSNLYRSTARQPGGAPGDRVIEAEVSQFSAVIRIFGLGETETLVLDPQDVGAFDALIEVLKDIRDDR